MPRHQAYRRCVGIALFNRDGLVFLGRRKDVHAQENHRSDFQWQMPQGGIGEGEEAIAAARRELWEETGVQHALYLGESNEWLRYDFPPEVAEHKFHGRYIGQEQKWFALRFNGKDSEIDISAGHGHEPEFDAWRWERIDRLVDLVVPFKRKVYQAVVKKFIEFSRV